MSEAFNHIVPSHGDFAGSGKFCLGVELHRGGSATNGANPSSFTFWFLMIVVTLSPSHRTLPYSETNSTHFPNKDFKGLSSTH